MHTKVTPAHTANPSSVCMHLQLGSPLRSSWRASLKGAETDRGRAALAWTEPITLITESRAPDAVYKEVRQRFTEQELVNLTMAMVAINGLESPCDRIQDRPGNIPAADGALVIVGGDACGARGWLPAIDRAEFRGLALCTRRWVRKDRRGSPGCKAAIRPARHARSYSLPGTDGDRNTRGLQAPLSATEHFMALETRSEQEAPYWTRNSRTF